MTKRAGVLAALVLALLATACRPPGTDGIALVDTRFDRDDRRTTSGVDHVSVELPHIPAIRLPDLSGVRAYDQLLEERLGALELRPIDGVEVVEGTCADGDAIYSGSERSDVFDRDDVGYGESFAFEIDETTGAAEYTRDHVTGRTRVVTHGDGSGTFVDESPTADLSIEVFADGSGHYVLEEVLQITSVDAEADGSGVFVRESRERLMTVTLRPDGSGALYAETRDSRGEVVELLTIDARSDGSGDLFFEHDGRVVTLRVRSDRSWEYADRSFGRSVSVVVRSDRSGQFRERGGSGLTVDFAADGANLHDVAGPSVVLPETPLFVVADRFPELGTLATIEPPCATVLRFDSALLFEVNEAEVLPDAAALLAEVAPALIDAGRPIEVNGHTDANGSDEYNQDLSERRAEAIAAELRALGVEVEMTVQGFGETQPVAPNYHADGSDDLAGQRQNRRVELVIHG